MKTRSTRFHRIILDHLGQVKRDIALGLLCLIGSTVMSLLAPWPIKFIVDQILLQKPWPTHLAFLSDTLTAGTDTALMAVSAAIVGLALATGAFSYFQQYLTSRIGYGIVYRLRGELFAHLQRLSLSFHNRARTGEMLSKVTSDTNTLRDVYSEYVLTLMSNVMTIAGMCIVLFVMNWSLALIVSISFLLLFIPLHYVLHRIKRFARTQRSHEGKLASRVGDMLSSVLVVQAFGREHYERTRFEEESAQSMAESIRTARMEAASSRLAEIATAVSLCVVMYFGSLQALQGRMTPGDLLIFISYVTSMYRPVKHIARLSARISKASASAERIGHILQAEPDIADVPDAKDARGLRGDISFRNVSFGYEPDKPVFSNLSFTIPAGKHVALVGASGTGKSTITTLILRLYDVQQGSVSIDGINVKEYRRDRLREEIGVVLQDTLLFGATIRENIAYGKLDATNAEIEEAARLAHAHEFIVALPDGYDSILGERGSTLSGGQRQRISLARALVKRSPILIVDEPLSAVDQESALLIRDAMRHVQQGKTLLLIAHQLAAVKEADWILVLKNGRIIEQGTHAELSGRGGWYCELFHIGKVKGPMAQPFFV